MKIVFDEAKRQSNLAKHGLDFIDIDLAFFEASIVIPANKGRYMAVGILENSVVAVVFTRLGSEGVSIISMRPASRKERSLL